jgi:hypothetical protein
MSTVLNEDTSGANVEGKLDEQEAEDVSTAPGTQISEQDKQESSEAALKDGTEEQYAKSGTQQRVSEGTVSSTKAVAGNETARTTDQPPAKKKEKSGGGICMCGSKSKTLEDSEDEGMRTKEASPKAGEEKAVGAVKADIEVVFQPGSVGLGFDTNALVTRVIDGTQAQRKGLKPGMRIVSINGEPFTTSAIGQRAKRESDYTVVLQVAQEDAKAAEVVNEEAKAAEAVKVEAKAAEAVKEDPKAAEVDGDATRVRPRREEPGLLERV